MRLGQPGRLFIASATTHNPAWLGESCVTDSRHDAKRAALLASSLFQAMQPDELDGILRFAVERRVPRGQMIFQKGSDGSSLMAVLRGRVRISTVSAEGREIVLNMINPGEVFGEIALLDGKPRSADATAIEITDLLIVERQHFVPFLKTNDDLYLRLLGVLCERLRRTSMALEDLALFGLPTRLARLLLKFSEDYGRRTPAGMRIELKLSQRDISTLVAASRETVNKQLSQWREEGVIAMEAGCLLVKRPDILSALLE